MNRMYTELLPIMLIPSTLSGFVTGIHANSSKDLSSVRMFTNWIGYTSIGIMTGITYPVSFPLLAGYVLYKN